MKNSAAILCSLALCLWGYQTGAWQLAIPMVLALEARHLIKRQWTISEGHFKFIPVVAAFAWLLSIFYIPLNSPSPIPYAASHHILKCLPVGLFPAVLAQTYCLNFTSLCRALLRQPYRSKNKINLYYPYLGICLLAASVTGGNTALFLTLTAALVAGLLGTLRSQRFSSNLFLGLIGLAVIISLMGTYHCLWLQANVKLTRPDLVSTFLQNLASSVSKQSNQPREYPFKTDSSKDGEPHTSNTDAKTSQIAPQDAEGAAGSNSFSPSGTGGLDASQPKSQQGGNTGNLNPARSALGTLPPMDGTGDINPSQTIGQQRGGNESAVATAASQSVMQATQAIEGSGTSQSPSPPTGSTSSINTSSQPAPQGGNPETTPPVTSVQGASVPTAGSTNTNGTAAPQSPDQRDGETSVTSASQASQDPNPTSRGTGNPSSMNAPSSGIVQQAGGDADPHKSSTQIGKSGSLQLSDAVLFRVAPNPGSGLNAPTFPLYIREAAYNQYSLEAWNAVTPKFSQSAPSNQQRWIFRSQTPNTASVRISANLPDRQGVLKLPVGPSGIEGLAADSVQVNQYGTVMIQGKPGDITYTVQFDPTQSLDSPPTQLELDIPPGEQPALQKILKLLALEGKSEQDVVGAIATFFKKDFQYSLALPQPQKNTTPISAFLLNSRSGHCEYFASATSLLLRAAGIPTRYVVGYSVHEYSPSQQQYIVRARNAHAWVTAYVNGAWITVDTTPGDGLLEGGNAAPAPNSGLSPDGKIDMTPAGNSAQPKKVNAAIDPKDGGIKKVKSLPKAAAQAWSSLLSLLSKNINTVLWASAAIVLGLAIIFCSLFFAWRAMRHRYRSRRTQWLKGRATGSSDQPVTDGLDSEFYLIEKRLGEWGLERKASETVRQWILRLKQTLPEANINHLNQIIDLHYRYRFDPQGIVQEDRARLRSMIHTWLTETTV